MIDVLIAGGGVAGCAAAIGLAHRGFSVAVVEASGKDSPRKARQREREEHVGEMLGPSIRIVLTELGVWDRFAADRHLPCYGMHSAWGRPELYSNDFVFHPHGSGWHIDRARFDGMLSQAAREAGAVFYPGAAPAGVEEIKAGWSVAVGGREGPFEVKARFLMDATGRSASLARKLGAQRIELDRGVAVARCYRLLPGHAPQDSFTLVEASPDGWWYSALRPSGEMTAQYFTDPEFRSHAEPPPHTAARLRETKCVTAPKVYSTSSSCLNRIAGQRWLALGDAASTWDPLSSQGIAKALRSGRAAADAAAGHFGGDANAISGYVAQARDSFNRYVEVRQHYYRQEKRWPASPFWQRRQNGDDYRNGN